MIKKCERQKFFVFHAICSELMLPILSASRMIYGDVNPPKNSQVFLLCTPKQHRKLEPSKYSLVAVVEVAKWSRKEMESFLEENEIWFEDEHEQKIKKLHEETEGLACHVCEFVKKCINEVSRVAIVLEILSTGVTQKAV